MGTVTSEDRVTRSDTGGKSEKFCFLEKNRKGRSKSWSDEEKSDC